MERFNKYYDNYEKELQKAYENGTAFFIYDCLLETDDKAEIPVDCRDCKFFCDCWSLQ